MGSFAKPAGPRFSIQVLYDDSEHRKLHGSTNGEHWVRERT